MTATKPNIKSLVRPCVPTGDVFLDSGFPRAEVLAIDGRIIVLRCPYRCGEHHTLPLDSHIPDLICCTRTRERLGGGIFDHPSCWIRIINADVWRLAGQEARP